MELESYFDFLAPYDIRLKHSRIGIENILYEYIYRNKTAEQLAERFPSLSLEQIYATILYYLHEREKVDAYLMDWINFGKAARAEQAANPSPAILRLQKLIEENRRVVETR